MTTSNNVIRSPDMFSYLIWSFLCITLIVPIEIYLGGVFLRPILLGTLFIWIVLGTLSLANLKPVKLYALNSNYILYMFILCSFFIVQSAIQGRYLVGIKETIEIAASLALMLLLVKITLEVGLIRSLQALRNITFFGSLIWVSSNFMSGNYVTFKDPYWILLISCLLSLIFLKIRGNKTDIFILSILAILAILSASRTLWATCIVFAFVLFGLLRFIIPGIFLAALLIVISTLDQQYAYYFDTVNFIFNNFTEIINDVQVVNTNLDNKSDQVRIIESLRAFSIFLDNPIFGVGLDNYQGYITGSRDFDVEGYLTPHNEFLRVLAEGGITLFLIYLLLYRSIWNDISKIYFNEFKLIGHALILASLTLAFFTATNYTFHFILQLSLMCFAGCIKSNSMYLNSKAI